MRAWLQAFVAALCALLGAGSVALGGTGTWNRPGGGNWLDPASWSGDLPDAAGDVAIFSGALPSLDYANIVVDSPTTVGSIYFYNNRQPTIQGPQQLTLDGGASGNSSIAMAQAVNDIRIYAPLFLATDVRIRGGFQFFVAIGSTINGSGNMIFERGQTLLAGSGSAYSGETRVEGGLVRFISADDFGSTSGITRIANANATIDLRTSTAESFQLDNASGLAYNGAIIPRGGGDYTISGSVDLGSQRSYINGQSRLILAGAVTGGGLTKVGPGSVRFTQDTVAYTGPTVVGLNAVGGSVSVGDYARLASTSDITVNTGGIFNVNNFNFISQNLSDRLGDSIPVALRGGRLNYIGSGSGASTETIGQVTLDQGFSTIAVESLASPGATLTFGGLVRSAGAIVQFSENERGILGGSGSSDPRIKLASAPTLTNGIIGGWALVTTGDSFMLDFAAYDPARGVYPLEGTRAPQVEGASAVDNVSISSVPDTLTQDRSINSLRFARNVVITDTLNLGGHQLNIVTGALLKLYNGGLDITNGSITAGSAAGAELLATIGGSATIQANITDNGAGAVSLVKSGPGRLTLTGNNTYSGGTTVNGGVTEQTGHAPRGELVVNTLGAIPVDSDVTVNNGAYRVDFNTLSPLDLGQITVRHNGVIQAGPNTLDSNVVLNADSYQLESGFVLPRLAGNGPMTKTTDGTATLDGNNQMYSGTIQVNGGIFAARGTNVLGAGKTIVNSGGRLVLQVPTVNGDVDLVGGELAPADPGSSGTVRTFAGKLQVYGTSRILTFDGLAIDNVDAIDIKLTGPVTVTQDATLEIVGRNAAQLLGNLSLGGNARIIADEPVLIKPASGKTVSGSGMLDATIQIGSGSVLSPGNSAGLLSIEGSYQQMSGGTALFEIGGLMAGSQFDRLDVTGSASLAGTLNLALINGFAPSRGDSFQIISAGSRSGQFSTVNGRNLGGGLSFDVLYQASGVSLVVIPEASISGLLGIVGWTLIGGRWRRV